MRLFSTEQVSGWHPDKYADQISDAILMACITQDPNSQCGIETLVKDYTVVLGGEITTNAIVDYEAVVHKVAKDLNYRVDNVINLIGKQSQEIASGILRDEDSGAGDQGFMVGFATRETESMLPYGFDIANKIIRAVENDIETNANTIFIGDAKCQVTVDLDLPQNVGALHTILISVCHKKGYTISQVKDYIFKNILVGELDFSGNQNIKYLINPAGEWNVGGAVSDCGLCLNGDTLVSTPNGLIKMKELKVGDTVYTESGTANILEFYDNGIKDTFVVKDEFGTEIEATLNHPFRVWDGDNITWRKAGDLSVGDILIKKRQKFLSIKPKDYEYPTIEYTNGREHRQNKIIINSDFAYLIGCLIGDGNTTADDRITFYYGCEEDKQHTYKELLKVFRSDDIKHYEYQDDRFYILSKTLVTELYKLGVLQTTARHKEVPSFVLKGNDKLKKAFIGGLFDTDGCVDGDGGRDGEYITIQLTTSSKTLAQQVGVLLQSLGVKTTIDIRQPACEHYKKDGSFIKGSDISYAIRIVGLKSIKYFIEYCGLRNPRRLSKTNNKIFGNKWKWNEYSYYKIHKPLKELLDINTYKAGRYFENYNNPKCLNRGYAVQNITEILDMYAEYANTDQYKKIKNIIENFEFAEIKTITKSSAHTYDITLDDDTHSFVANGFIVHNTGRKIVCDQYGGYCAVGGGAFSGKSFLKVDRSGAYMARYLAKWVLNNYPEIFNCEVQLAYAIGISNPISVNVKTDKKELDSEISERIIREFNLTPIGIVKFLNLDKVDFYKLSQGCHYRKMDGIMF